MRGAQYFGNHTFSAGNFMRVILARSDCIFSIQLISLTETFSGGWRWLCKDGKADQLRMVGGILDTCKYKESKVGS